MFVTPDVSIAHAFVRAAARASRCVAPSTVRQAVLPVNSMHTAHRAAPAWKLA
jgi:hypothetical protein